MARAESRLGGESEIGALVLVVHVSRGAHNLAEYALCIRDMPVATMAKPRERSRVAILDKPREPEIERLHERARVVLAERLA